MQRDEMVQFVLWILRGHQPAREWGGLRAEAEDLVDQYLEDRAA